jgi:hypothetical protein
MPPTDLQDRCELGQRQLMEMDYLSAEATLAAAEQEAWDARDFDSLARLYLPLQESRRQRRQRCGEGIVCLDLLARETDDRLDLQQFTQGQLLVAGWGTLVPAIALRESAARRRLFVETFLAAVYPIGDHRAVVIAPLPETRLPDLRPRGIDALLAALPPHCIVLHEQQLPPGVRPATVETYGEVMALWERLHAPFLALADSITADPIRQIEAYRQAIRVDYACELAHQKISALARRCSRIRP